MSTESVVLVTGGSGLVGRAIQDVVTTDALQGEKYVFVSSKEVDLRDMEQTRKVFWQYRPTYVICMSCRYPCGPGQRKDITKIYKDNFKINQNVLQCCLELKVKKCLFGLSTAMFPEKTTYPVDESMIHDGPAAPAVYGYAYEKRYLEMLIRAHNQAQKETLFVGLILCNLYGPHDNFNLLSGNAVPCLIHRGYLAKHHGEALKIFGTGKALRQFMFSQDAARLILLVMRQYEQPTPLILSADEEDEISIRDAAEAVRVAFGLETEVEMDPSGSDGQIKKTACNRKMRGLWPHFKFKSFREGVLITANWLTANYNTCRK